MTFVRRGNVPTSAVMPIAVSCTQKNASLEAHALWNEAIAHLQGGGYIAYVTEQMWVQAVTAYVAMNTNTRLQFDQGQVTKFVAATCFHTRWCDGKSRGEAEKVLRHTAKAAFLVRGLAKHRILWKSDVFYFALKKHCLSYMDQFTDWLDSDVYGGDALSEERLLGVAHHQFNIDAQRPPVRHLDILPPVPLDKRTMKPFKNDYRFIVALHMIALSVMPEFEKQLQVFCQANKCGYRLRRLFTIQEQVDRVLTDYFDEEAPRAAFNTATVKAVVHADVGDLKTLMAKAEKHFGTFLRVENDFETSVAMEGKYVIIRCFLGRGSASTVTVGEQCLPFC